MYHLAKFKEMQKEGWAKFVPLEAFTTPTAAQLVKFAGPVAGKRVLDVGCGTGVVAITAARQGASVTGIDLTPTLLVRAKENARIANVEVEWQEGDAEALTFGDGSFDIVLSQFGHMFAPRPEVALAEMLRVLKSGGTLAFSTWPPEQFVGRGFHLMGSYMPPLPPNVSPPPLWGDPNIVRERLGDKVKGIAFDRGRMLVPALSPQHFRETIERTAGPVVKLVEILSTSDPAKLATLRRDYESLIAEYWEDNLVRQDYLMTRAVKS